jgi:hypothetical protein
MDWWPGNARLKLLKLGVLYQSRCHIYSMFQELADEYFEAIVSSKISEKLWSGQSRQAKQYGYISTDGVSVSIQYLHINQSKEKAWRCDDGKEGSKKRKRDEGEETCIGSGDEEKPKPNTKKERAKAHRDSLVHKGTFHKDSIVVGIDPGRCAPVYAYR